MENSYFIQVIKALSVQSSESEFKFFVKGGSMSPLINNGDIVYVKQISSKTLSIGDIIVILFDNDILTHRLVCIRKDRYYCKGDSTHIPDPPIKGEQIFGKVFAIESRDKRIVLDDQHWKTKNKILGYLSNLESQLYAFGTRFITNNKHNTSHKPHIFIGRMIIFPIRAIIRLISRS